MHLQVFQVFQDEHGIFQRIRHPYSLAVTALEDFGRIYLNNLQPEIYSRIYTVLVSAGVGQLKTGHSEDFYYIDSYT
ncbi:MAG: hypothetical protein DRZ90_14985, partial [Spirochaetes bacterium]